MSPKIGLDESLSPYLEAPTMADQWRQRIKVFVER